MISFGKYIRKLRHQRKKSPQEVADFLNISSKFLAKIENGQFNATKTQVFQLASYLQEDESRLLASYLRDQVSQANQPTESSERVQKISSELEQLHSRHLQTKIHKPSSPLDSYIKNFIYYCGNNKGHPYEREFPDGTVQFTIELDGNPRLLLPDNRKNLPVSLKKSWITGVQKQPSTFQLGDSERTLTIQFTSDGFYALTNIPVNELRDSFIDAETIFGSSISILREQLLDCRNVTSIFQIVEEYFLNEIPSQKEETFVIKFIVNNIGTSLSELVDKTGYSHKHVIHLFKKHVGISPKSFHQICRFKKTLNDILTTRKEVDWSDIVYNNGYYDQSHFIREFNHFTGMNPNDYLETGSTCSKLLHLNEVR